MRKTVAVAIILLLICCLVVATGIAQTNEYVLRLHGDTLVTASGKTITAGQYLVIGKGKGENGWYRSIGFKHLSNFMVLLNPANYYTNNNTGSSDPQDARRNDLVVTLLPPGDTAYIKAVHFAGNKRYGKWYNIELVRKGFPKTRFTCNADTALKYGEIILP